MDIAVTLSVMGRWQQGVSRITSSAIFETYILTLVFGLCLYIADIVSDVVNGLDYLSDGHIWWGTTTLGLVLVPGLVRGFYELFRRSVIYEVQEESSSSSVPFKRGSRSLRVLNFGLDILPQINIGVPKFLPLQCLLAIIYVLFMALWFPFLPLIQFFKLFRLQMSFLYRKRTQRDLDVERINDEIRRAIKFKSVETFLEAAPQLFLQIYITYKREDIEEAASSFVAMALSFISLLKTCYDLQEVNREENAVSAPPYPVYYFLTSVFWFASTLAFHSLSVSVISLYLNQYHIRGISLVPIVTLVIANVILRSCVKSSEALMDGAMSAVAPAKYICESKKGSEHLTKVYLISYTVINTTLHSVGLGVLFGLNHTTDLPGRFAVDRLTLQHYVVPTIALFAILSITTGIMHWKISLRSLFRAQCKYPLYAERSKRLASFPSFWKHATHYFTPAQFADSGFFCSNGAKGHITCYDCGVNIRDLSKICLDLDVQHLLAILKYRQFWMIQKPDHPDRARCVQAQLSMVKKECAYLREKRISFNNYLDRLKSFRNRVKDTFETDSTERSCADAGLVRLNLKTAMCFKCYALVPLTSAKESSFNPLSEHVWAPESDKCDYLKVHLLNYHNRLKTFPPEWYQVSGSFPKPDLLSHAGFHCRVWNVEGRSLVRCFACRAFVVLWPSAFKGGMEELANMANSYGRTLSDMPAMTYGIVNPLMSLENPLLLHYIQNLDCPFVQDTLRSSYVRMTTFPKNWSESNELSVTAKEVADAGFVYYPPGENRGQWQKVGNMAGCPGMSNTCNTLCPLCLEEVDWSKESRAPSEVMHCEARARLMQKIAARRKTSVSEKSLHKVKVSNPRDIELQENLLVPES